MQLRFRAVIAFYRNSSLNCISIRADHFRNRDRQVELFRRAVDAQIALFETTYAIGQELDVDRLDEIFVSVSTFGTVYDDEDEILQFEVLKAIKRVQQPNSESNSTL